MMMIETALGRQPAALFSNECATLIFLLITSGYSMR